MYQDAIDQIRQLIFPIFFQVQVENQVRIGVSGTGFFINEKGAFITANHVITDTPQGSRLLYVGNVPRNPIAQPIEIEEVWSDVVRDIFVGRVSASQLPPVNLGAAPVPPGQSVCLCGYPLARITPGPNNSINVQNVRQYWQPTTVIDGFQSNINDRHYVGFMTQHTSLRGMSGGPVFGIDGVVVGMDVATLTRRIPEPDGRETLVPNGIAIGINVIRQLLPQEIEIV